MPVVLIFQRGHTKNSPLAPVFFLRPCFYEQLYLISGFTFPLYSDTKLEKLWFRSRRCDVSSSSFYQTSQIPSKKWMWHSFVLSIELYFITWKHGKMVVSWLYIFLLEFHYVLSLFINILARDYDFLF